MRPTPRPCTGAKWAPCAHQVTFDRPEAYAITGDRQQSGVTAVIDSRTLANKVAIRSFMTGIAQMFARYEYADTYREPAPGPRRIVVELAIPGYAFDDFRAKVAVSAAAYDRGGKPLLRKTYTAEGEPQGGKMFWGGAFSMKSAIRQSSLDAYKKVFAQLRADLAEALAKQLLKAPALRSACDRRARRRSCSRWSSTASGNRKQSRHRRRAG